MNNRLSNRKQTSAAARVLKAVERLSNRVTAHPRLRATCRTLKLNDIYRQFRDVLIKQSMDDEVTLQVGDHQVKYKTDEQQSKRWFWPKLVERQVYEGPVVTLMEDQIRKGDFVIDIGSHIGYFTNIASHLAGSEGRVHAYEISSDAHRLLKKT